MYKGGSIASTVMCSWELLSYSKALVCIKVAVLHLLGCVHGIHEVIRRHLYV